MTANSCKSVRGQGVQTYLRKPILRDDLLSALLRTVSANTSGGSTSLSHAGEPATLEIERLDLSGKRILLVEDNAINRQVAMGLLAETECVCVTAADGQEAVDRMRTEPFDLVPMDMQMPVMGVYRGDAAHPFARRASGQAHADCRVDGECDGRHAGEVYCRGHGRVSAQAH